MKIIKIITLLLSLGLTTALAARTEIMEEEEVAVPEELLRLAAKLRYPASVCAITDMNEAQRKCLPGEILWYAPEKWHGEPKLSPLAAAANYCDLKQTVLHDEQSVVCIYNHNLTSVSRELGIRVMQPEVADIDQQYTQEFSRILNSNPNITRLDENLWVQVVNEGSLRGSPFREGDRLWVEFHLLSPRLTDEGTGHYFKDYSYSEAENSYFLSMLHQYWDQLNADLLVYSDLSLLPQEIQEQDLFGSTIPRAYHVIFRKLTDKDGKDK